MGIEKYVESRDLVDKIALPEPFKSAHRNYLAVEELALGVFENEIQKPGMYDSSEAFLLKSLMTSLAESMIDEVYRLNNPEQDFLESLPLGSSIKLTVGNLPSAQYDKALQKVRKIAEIMRPRPGFSTEVNLVNTSENNEALEYGTPLALFYLYDHEFFYPAESEWQEDKKAFEPIFSSINKQMRRYLDPDQVASSFNVPLGFKDITGKKGWSWL